MHSLASVFVSLVVVANTLFPNSNIPRVLGVNTAESGSSEALETPKPSGSASLFQRVKTTLELNNKNDEKEGTPSATKRKREEFNLKLKEVRDEGKRQRLTSLDGNITKINQKAVQRWNKVLDKLTQILERIKTKTNEASTNGKDVTSILAAITVAEGKIADAKAAVTAQSGKSYIIDISTTQNFGESASSTVQTMRANIKAVEAKVKDAIQSVKDVYKALKEIIGTETPKPSETP